MKKFIVKAHSVIDLITNSSTEMFVDFTNSIEPFKEMINEIFNLFDIDKTCDDVFELSIRNSYYDDDDYIEEIVESHEGDENFDREAAIKKAMEPDGESMTVLHIEVKDDKYKHLGELIMKFLDSTELNEYMC